jgi:hypothetical protein
MTVSGHGALFLTHPVKKSKQPPVVIVGLPRSGSSFLAHVISHLSDWFIFDDLYLYREAKAINAENNPLTLGQLDKLLFFLGWQIRARINFGVFCIPNMALDEVDQMNQALKETFKNTPVYWYELQEEWMTRLCLNQGCKFWGYKAPQDFQLTDMLDKVYPGIKYIFLFRDPRKMLRSLKFVRDEDGTPEQYHSVIYSYYWKKAMHTMAGLCDSIPSRILSIKYEDLAKDPQNQAQKIADYLNTSVLKPIDTSRTNSSFKSTGDQDITPTETKICEMITNQYLVKYNYTTQNGVFRIHDISDLMKTSFVFTMYQLNRIFLNKSARVSIILYMKNIFKL